LRDALKVVNRELAAGTERISESAVTAMMLAHWQFMNRAHPFERLVVFLSYWTGFILLSLVSLVSVFEILYNAM